MPADRTNPRDPAEITPQDESLLAIFDGADPFADGGGVKPDRAVLETLGLMATSLPPASTQPGRKEALFHRLNLNGDASDTVLPFAAIKRPIPADRRPAPWVPLALAAAVLLAVGLGSWSGFLFSELRQSRVLVAGLESELRSLETEPLATGEYQKVLFENQQLRSQIGLATRPRTRVCALSAMDPAQPEAKGAVFLRPEDGEWVIATNNLAKCELGRRYRLWFLGLDGSVMGGEVLEHVTGERKIETASGVLPRGTAAVLVTLEFPDQFGDQPGGERVLYGDRSVEIY